MGARNENGGSPSGLMFVLVCIGSLISVILAIIFILFLVVIIMFRMSDKPQIRIKEIQVPNFEILATQNPPNLTANMDVLFESDNENKFVGLEFWNVAMQTEWFEGGVDVNGTNQIQHHKQGGRSVHNLPKMNVEFKDVQITRSNLKKEDIKLDITLRGKLSNYLSFIWSVKHRFKITCEKVGIGSHYVPCKFQYVNVGNYQWKPRRRIGKYSH